MKGQVAPALKRLGYHRSVKGNVALLDDDLPGLDRSLPRILSKALAKRGLGVTRLDAEAVSNPYLLTTDRFDVLILGDSRLFPASALDSLQTFLESGGALVARVRVAGEDRRLAAAGHAASRTRNRARRTAYAAAPVSR